MLRDAPARSPLPPPGSARGGGPAAPQPRGRSQRPHRCGDWAENANAELTSGGSGPESRNRAGPARAAHYLRWSLHGWLCRPGCSAGECCRERSAPHRPARGFPLLPAFPASPSPPARGTASLPPLSAPHKRRWPSSLPVPPPRPPNAHSAPAGRARLQVCARRGARRRRGGTGCERRTSSSSSGVSHCGHAARGVRWGGRCCCLGARGRRCRDAGAAGPPSAGAGSAAGTRGTGGAWLGRWVAPWAGQRAPVGAAGARRGPLSQCPETLGTLGCPAMLTDRSRRRWNGTSPCVTSQQSCFETCRRGGFENRGEISARFRSLLVVLHASWIDVS